MKLHFKGDKVRPDVDEGSTVCKNLLSHHHTIAHSPRRKRRSGRMEAVMATGPMGRAKEGLVMMMVMKNQM